MQINGSLFHQLDRIRYKTRIYYAMLALHLTDQGGVSSMPPLLILTTLRKLPLEAELRI